MLMLKRKITQQTSHLYQPRPSGHVLVFWCIWRMMFHKLHVIRHLATYSSKTTEKRLTVFRHLVGYLCSHMDVCVSLTWGGQATGIFHNYPNVDPNEHVLEVFTDFDWDSEDHFVVISWSRSLRLQQWSQWRHPTCQVVNMDHQQKNPHLHLHWQQWCQRNLESKGSWTFETLSCRILWLQDMVGNGMLKLCSISGHSNPADIGTKRLAAPRIRSLMSLNRSNGCLEGADDPGRVFVRRVNGRALAGALSLIQLHLQGCDSTLEDGCNLFILLFTLCVGVGMIGFSIGLQELQRALKTMTLLFWRNQLWTRSMMTKMGQSECPTLALQSSLPTASFLRAMLQARARAFEIQLRCLFWETKVICQSPTLHGALKQCLPLCIQGVCAENPQQFRWNDSTCMRSDLNYFATWWMLASLEIKQFDCQQLSWPGTWQTFQAMRSLQTMAKAGFSCATPWMRLNMQWRWVKVWRTQWQLNEQQLQTALMWIQLPRALMENIDNPPMDEAGESEDEDSDEMMETESQTAFRYANSELCEVSDPEAWVVMHHGNVETSESEQMEDDAET